MADIATISALLTSVKTATDIAKLIKDSDSSLEAAEFKLNMAELISNLADVKIEVATLQDELRTRDEEILRLQKELTSRLELRYDSGTEVYWVEGDSSPYCPVCYENDEKLIHLTALSMSGYGHSRKPNPHHSCKVCNKSFFKTSKKSI
ncbi:hypothetical protein BA894_19635 [Vibrio natriegens]|uniref:hypothetical protein n=1 Tax=Vibrio natriegens TaxID=691 RepID=UPI00080404BF|nr:hypothetical protein [Vibrio natriegens]ANQ28626.1 hypothetical protein BA894_19635 [Vibrio natriegens]